jgi:hypothetical protein
MHVNIGYCWQTKNPAEAGSVNCCYRKLAPKVRRIYASVNQIGYAFLHNGFIFFVSYAKPF